MKNELYQMMYENYQQGFSLAKVGRIYGISRQSVYGGFKCRNYKLRTNKKLPFKTFNDIKFTLRNNGYYGRTDGDRGLMHRYVWEFYNGIIPVGHDLHHINFNKLDNRIENLEIYTKSKHAEKFNTGSNQYVKRSLQETN